MLKIIGHPASQPSRAVFWACLLHDLPFVLAMPGTGQSSGNPRGQVPWLDDDGFRLAESAAIMTYLARKHRWQAFYPKSLTVRARIDQWLHMHHSLVRLATMKLMVTHVMKPLEGAIPIGDNPLSVGAREHIDQAFAVEDAFAYGQPYVRTICNHLESAWFDSDGPFLCGTDGPTPADLMGYAELGQLRINQLFDFGGYPRVQAWLDAMQAIPHHDAVHAYNLALGDIHTRPNTLERFMAASEAGTQALTNTGLVRRGEP